MVKVRPAQLNDAAEVARVHVDAWRFTYGGFMPAEYLASLSYEAFEGGWRRDTLLNDPKHPRWVAVLDGAIVGFLIAGDAAYEVPGYPNELRALYTKPGVQRKGVGRALMETYQHWLLSRGESAYHLWVGKQNERAHAFYEAVGGKRVAERSDRIFGGMVIPEWGYGWDL
jgi:GNAT superfamily N-acetyltransferase